MGVSQIKLVISPLFRKRSKRNYIHNLYTYMSFNKYLEQSDPVNFSNRKRGSICGKTANSVILALYERVIALFRTLFYVVIN